MRKQALGLTKSKQANVLIPLAQGGDEVTVPGDVQECGDVALGEMVGGHGEMGWGLDLVVWQVFSNLNGSLMVFCDSVVSLHSQERCLDACPSTHRRAALSYFVHVTPKPREKQFSTCRHKQWTPTQIWTSSFRSISPLTEEYRTSFGLKYKAVAKQIQHWNPVEVSQAKLSVSDEPNEK